MSERRTIKNLGYCNGWGETPEIVKKCRELQHKRSGVKVGNCLNTTVCEICGYSYKTDSSG